MGGKIEGNGWKQMKLSKATRYLGGKANKGETTLFESEREMGKREEREARTKSKEEHHKLRKQKKF